jgi:hypothetical protein
MENELNNNPDIQDALKEFEAGSDATTQAQPTTGMTPLKKEVAGISFETDSYAGFKYIKQSDTPKIITLVKNYSGGIIKEDKHAEYVLLALVGLIVIISLFLVFRDYIYLPPPQPTPEEVLRMERLNYEMSQRPSN